MIFLIRIFMLYTLTAILNISGLHATGFLRAYQKKIVDGSGQEIILRGMGLGGWMLQEGYMYQLGFLGRQYLIRNKIEQSVGKDKADEFYERWLNEHTTKKDIDQLAAMGFNSIRLPMHYALYTFPVEMEPEKGKNTWIEKGFALTDSLLEWCKQNKMYLILDLHAAPGGQGNDLPISDRDPARPSLWESKENQDKTIALWKKLAEKYANEPWIGGYDILNETNWGFDDPADTRGTREKHNKPLQQLMQRITKAIREVDRNHMIILEGNGFANNYAGIEPTWDDNLVISFHRYGIFNTPQTIQHFLDLRDKYNVPLWLGETGENSNTWFTESIRLMEKNHIGWAWWQHKKMGVNNPFEVKKPKDYDRLLADWSGKGPKLSQQEAWTILQEWLDNVAFHNNIIHSDVADAMFRQVNTATAVPYMKIAIGKDPVVIPAVYYDLGAQRIAYYDKDSASYHYTPGVNTVGNKGNMFRNDGVDIKKDQEGYYIFNMEEGEWLQYTVDVKQPGKYFIKFNVRSSDNNVLLSLIINDKPAIQKIVSSTSSNWSYTTPYTIELKKGKNRLKIAVKKDGVELRDFQIEKK